jgi:hypothetical protein
MAEQGVNEKQEVGPEGGGEILAGMEMPSADEDNASDDDTVPAWSLSAPLSAPLSAIDAMTVVTADQRHRPVTITPSPLNP